MENMNSKNLVRLLEFRDRLISSKESVEKRDYSTNPNGEELRGVLRDEYSSLLGEFYGLFPNLKVGRNYSSIMKD